MTFARPESPYTRVLQKVCCSCKSMEADMLLVELANALEGQVTMCSGDSDLVAVFKAYGCQGLTMRMEKGSYREGSEMHLSAFGELVCARLPGAVGTTAVRVLSHKENRLNILCDLGREDDVLLSDTRKRHDTFMGLLESYDALEMRNAKFTFDMSEYL
ncbi:hypothetical protein XENOCAPTIV_027423, partial [Xenoophorus captivus]